MRRKMGTVGEVSDDGSWRRWMGVFVGEEGRGGGGSTVGVRGGGRSRRCAWGGRWPEMGSGTWRGR